MKRTRILPENKFFQNSVLLYVLLMVSVFPLFCPSKYFHIQEDHLNFFTVVTWGLLSLFLISLVVYYYQVSSQYEGAFGTRIQQEIKKLSITDYAFFALLISCIISTCFSYYPEASFTGENGRLMGLSTYLLLFITYFLVSRGFKFKNYVIIVLLITADIMSLIAVLQRSGCDVFGLFKNLSITTQLQYISTIGNIDFFSSYVMLTLPISACLFCFYDNKLNWFYFLSTLMSFAALIVANADSGFAAAALMFVMLGIFCFKSLKTLKKFIAVLFAFFASCRLEYFLIRVDGNAFASLKSIPHALLTSHVTLICLIITAVLMAAAYYFNYKGCQFEKSLKFLKLAFISLALLLVAILVFIFIWFSWVDTSKPLGYLGNYLRFNNQWGDNRGYIFSLAIGSFIKFNPFQKLFGYGMDMFKIVIMNLLNFKPSQLSQFQIYDSAHNELLNQLISTGLVGCASYIVFIISQIVKNIKKSKKEPLLLVFAVCFSCYFIQSLANIAIPMVFPLLILLIAVSESINREMALKAALDATALTEKNAREKAQQVQKTKKAKNSPAKTHR
jgi:hypothetical protein